MNTDMLVALGALTTANARRLDILRLELRGGDKNISTTGKGGSKNRYVRTAAAVAVPL